MKKKVLCLLPVTLCLLLVFFTGCPMNEGTETRNRPPEEWAPISGIIKPRLKEGLNGVPVYTSMWGEPGQDPRCVLGYKLENSGRNFFSSYVLLYGLRLVDRDCASDSLKYWCNETGHHLCTDKEWMAGDIFNLYLNPAGYAKYIKPIRDAGIPVLMSLVPNGGGWSIGTLYNWPMEEVWSWADELGGGVYPYGPQPGGADKIIKQLRDWVTQYPFDGIAFDEEYSLVDREFDHMLPPATGPGPRYPMPDTSGQPYSAMAAAKGITGWESRAWRKGGENILRFAFEVEREMGTHFTVENYTWKYSTYIPAKYTYTDWDGNVITIYRDSTEDYVLRDDYDPRTEWMEWTDEWHKGMIDYTENAAYGGYWPQSNLLVDMPNRLFGPFPIDYRGNSYSPGVRPALSGSNSVDVFVERFVQGRFGVIMSYNLSSRWEHDVLEPNLFGPGIPVEGYLSRISMPVWGENVVYQGDDYAPIDYDPPADVMAAMRALHGENGPGAQKVFRLHPTLAAQGYPPGVEY